MSFTFEICIDEAGDDGFAFDKPDCTHWFVISGVISPISHQASITDVVRNLKAELGWKERKPLHFRDLRPATRRALAIQRLVEAQDHFRAISVLVHKPSLVSHGLREKHRLYHYLTRLLLERASWLCKASRAYQDAGQGDGTARVLFSKRTDLSYDQLFDYFQRLKQMPTSIDWEVLGSPSFFAVSNGKHASLQVADAIASAFFCADHHYEKSRTSEWVELLRPVMYSRNGKFRDYGVKIFPPEAEKRIAQGELAPWANVLFPT